MAGEAIRLDWITSHARSLSLFADDEPLEVPPASWARGSLELSPEATTRYRLEVVGPDRRTAAADREVRIEEAPGPTIERFAATPGRIAAGQKVSISWATRSTSSIRLIDDRGQPLSLDANLPSSGSLLIRPSRTTVYTLVASDGAASATATAAVDLVPPPRLEAQVSGAPVEAGGAARIEWQTVDADSLTLWEGARLLERIDPLEATSGHFEVLPRRASTYRLEARNIAGAAQRGVEVEVVPAIERFEVAGGPDELQLGMTLPLAWQVRGADVVTLVDPEGPIASWGGDPAAASWGQALEVALRAEGALELVAKNGAQETRRRLVPLLTRSPVIATFTVDSPPQLATPERPALVDLRWEVFGARTLLLHATPGGVVQLPPEARSSGAKLVEVEGPTTFTLVAENPWGIGSASLDARVEAPPRVMRFEAIPRRVAAGATATLVWEVSAAETLEIWQGALRLETFSDEEALVGALPVVVATGETFELRAYSSAGGEDRAEVTVAIGAPTIESFGSARRWFAPGEPLSLSWQSSGGDRLELRRDGVLLHSTEDAGSIQAGGTTVSAPAAPGPAVYSLSISHAAGAATATFTAEVTEGPIVLRFDAGEERLTAGDELELSWSLRGGTDGQEPALLLRGEEGRSYELGAADLAAARTRVRLDEAGLHTLTLQATGAAGASDASVTVEVLPPPALLSGEATPPFAEAEGGAVAVAWQTAHATRLRIYPADHAGQRVGAALHETSDPARLAAGSIQVHPTLAAPDVALVLANELGAERSFHLRIGVSPPTITRFEAVPPSIARGGASTLVWATERSPVVELEVSERVETDEAFLDLDGHPAAVRLSIGAGPFDTALLPFPDGFVFLFDGASRSGLRVANGGYVSFDLLRESGVQTVAGFPDPNAPFVHLAPFLGRLDRGTGEVLYALLGEGQGRHLVVQFRGYSLAGAPASRLNFELVLWEGGAYDFRYGVMSLPSDPDSVAGAAAQIGSQDASGRRGTTLTNKAAVPGGLAGRSFHHPTVDLQIAVEAEARPFLSIAGAPGAVELTERSRFFTNALLPFPAGFTFPFAGSVRTAAIVTKDGYLSFEIAESISHASNRRLAQGAAQGAGGTSRLVHLAPLWANLSRLHGAGEIWAAIQDDGGGRALVIQWLRFAHESDPPSSLDFEILLREDGSFEYRYGAMFREEGGLSGGAGLASIGYQEPNGVRGVDLSFREAIPGGLAWTGWRFVPRPLLPPAGALEIHPRGTVEYRLTASGPTGTHRLLQTVEVTTAPDAP